MCNEMNKKTTPLPPVVFPSGIIGAGVMLKTTGSFFLCIRLSTANNRGQKHDFIYSYNGDMKAEKHFQAASWGDFMPSGRQIRLQGRM